MKKEVRDHLVLLRRRTFSEVFDDLGKFIRFWSKPFFKALLLIPGPFLFLSGIVSAYLGLLNPAGMSTVGSAPALIVILLLYLITSLLSAGTVVSFLRVLEGEGEEVSVASVRELLFRKLGPLCIWFLVWVCLTIAISFGLGITIGLLAMPMSGLHPGFPPLIIFLASLFLVPLIVHLATNSLYGMLGHDLYFGSAFSKAWDALLIAFWRNWSVILVGSVLMMMLSTVCVIPETLFSGIYNYITLDPVMEGLSGYILTGLSFIRYVSTHFLWTLFLVLLGLNYYSLHELQSGERLIQRFE